MNKINLFILTLLFVQLSEKSIAEKRRILFIGNSYTAVNDLPTTIKNLSLSFGDTLEIDSNTPGGMTLNGHTGNAATLAKIALGAWDYVVIQAQSQEPAFDPTQVASDTYPYAKILDSLIHVSSPCAETIFYMTWGRKNGDASNCPFYPPICTYEGMQQRLRESYLEMSLDNNASCAPVGIAWKYIRDHSPGIELYNADESHPTIHGTYLAACVFYASLYHRSPIGSTFISGGITATDATLLQTAANHIVLDSLENWQQYGSLPLSKFSFTNTQNQFSFTNQSLRSTQYEWNFGDGTALNTQTNPSHTFSALGTYTVSLKSLNNCGKYELSQKNVTVNMIPNLLNESALSDLFTLSYNNGVLQIMNQERASSLKVYNAQGALLQSFSLNPSHSKLLFRAPQGIYFYRLIKQNRTISQGKFLVH